MKEETENYGEPSRILGKLKPNMALVSIGEELKASFRALKDTEVLELRNVHISCRIVMLVE